MTDEERIRQISAIIAAWDRGELDDNEAWAAIRRVMQPESTGAETEKPPYYWWVLN